MQHAAKEIDSHCFDAFARTVTDVHPRGGELTTLLGGTLILLGKTETAAKKQKKGKKKTKPTTVMSTASVR